ncbi:MAG: tRNA (adenosine(37)-N6)-dimethylallyltransferase MiaA [Pseudomonadota bacterium]
MTRPQRPILLAGPTASGKSGLALALAERLGGWVINADSQQVYAAWRVLSARPSAEDEARAPHHLYGHLPLETPHSAGAWLREVDTVLAQAARAGARAIVTGGTGLNFRALTEGLSEIPATPTAIRAQFTALLERDGLTECAAVLRRRDPETAEKIDLANPARVQRALEVLEATGRGLSAWQAATPPPLLPSSRAIRLVIDAPADWSDQRIAARFDAMLAGGAIEEVAAVLATGADPSLPGMKAIGVAEIGKYLRGEATLEETAAAGTLATRRYAKRQRTWFRNQMAEWTRLPATGDLLAGALGAIEAAETGRFRESSP